MFPFLSLRHSYEHLTIRYEIVISVSISKLQKHMEFIIIESITIKAKAKNPLELTQN